MTNELTCDERKKWAQDIYLNEDIALKDIALKVRIDQASLRKWVKDGAWNETKRSMLTSKKAQLTLLYIALETVSGKIKEGNDINLKDIDLAVKYTNAIKNLEIEVSVSQIIEVFELFVLWLQRRDLPLSQKVIEYLHTFVKQREAA